MSQYFSLGNAFPVKQDTWHRVMCICVLDMQGEGLHVHLCQIELIQQVGVCLFVLKNQPGGVSFKKLLYSL